MLPVNESFKVWIVEDDEWYREFLRYTVSLNPDYEVKVFSNGKDLLKNLHEQPQVITLDYMLPGMNGAELLKKIKEYDTDIEVLIISEQDKIDTAGELLKAGAYDYFVKSKDLRDRLLNTIHHIRSNAGLKHRISDLEKEVGKKYDFTKRLIGNSAAFTKVFELIEKATKTNIIVLVFGETGTGKEEVAKAIHFNSLQRKGPFVAVNMAAVPADLAESELFGHEKGAFTGAVAARMGRFEEANGGTIFLDEIGELSLHLQAKLLRVLQEKEITRVGGNKIIKTNCRVMAATHRNLAAEVDKGSFRQDLYYRLLGLQIHLPPLRDRANDMLLLAKHFIDNFCRENKMPAKKLLPQAQQKLLSHHYPGNVRELKSIMELSAVMSNGEEISADDILLHPSQSPTKIFEEREMTLDEYNNRIIHHYLEKYDQNVLKVADKLGIGKSTIYRLLKKEEEQSR
jgi:DNA-binding NtrC family response regulator